MLLVKSFTVIIPGASRKALPKMYSVAILIFCLPGVADVHIALINIGDSAFAFYHKKAGVANIQRVRIGFKRFCRD
jgi:hypothetical protein